MPLRGTLLAGHPLKNGGLLVTGGHRVIVRDKNPQLGHFRKDHRHHFEGIDAIGGKLAGLFGLNN